MTNRDIIIRRKGCIMNNLRKIRKQKNVSQVEISQLLGITQSSYSRYEAGLRDIPNDVLSKLADYFGVSIDEILGRKGADSVMSGHIIDPADFPPKYPKNGYDPLPDPDNETALIPIVGEVHAGYDYLADENIEGYYQVEPRLKATYEHLHVLRVTGDSMYPELFAGDKVLCAPNVEVRSGDLAIVCINGDAGTVKRVRLGPGGITLIPTNKKYPEIHYSPEEVETLPVTIQSKVVEYRRQYK